VQRRGLVLNHRDVVGAALREEEEREERDPSERFVSCPSLRKDRSMFRVHAPPHHGKGLGFREINVAHKTLGALCGGMFYPRDARKSVIDVYATGTTLGRRKA
jgi:hypothetical protein